MAQVSSIATEIALSEDRIAIVPDEIGLDASDLEVFLSLVADLRDEALKVSFQADQGKIW